MNCAIYQTERYMRLKTGKAFMALWIIGFSILFSANSWSATTVLTTGTPSASISLNLTTPNAHQWGFSFTTGPSPASLDSIDIATNNTTATLEFSLYPSVGGKPVNGSLPVATYLVPSRSYVAYSQGNSSSLNHISFDGTLKTFNLAANTSYVLVASATTSSTPLIHWVAETSAAPTGSEGWSSSLNSVYSSDSGSTWASYTVDTPVYSLQVVAPPPPASLSPAVQTVAGTVGAPLTQTASMIPTGFGGTVTYTISPGLPNGLTFNNATGAIFGTPSAALTTTDFTIRAAGSTSGTATATVNLTIGVASQTITFGPTPTPTFSPSGGFQVFASATSGLPIIYSSLTPSVCEAQGSTIMMLGAGTCTLAANQSGNANYTAAPQVTQSITVTKAQPQPLTLSASSVSITVGGNSTLSATGGIPGGSVIYTVTGTCSAVSSLVTGGPGTGTCTATAMQPADANYLAVTSNPVAISVGVAQQAALSLTASPATISVNGVSTLTTQGGTGSGAVTYALNSGPCTLVGNALTATGVGQCQATATKAESTGYSAVTSNPVIVTINRLAPPALVLSTSPVSIGFNGTSTLSTTGGIPGAPVNYSVSGPCAIDGNTLLGVSAGLCIVTASQAETPVYGAATSTPVTVTVKERTTTFSYPHATAIIGQPFYLAPVTSGFTNPTYALLYGNLPAGLSLNPNTGVISGTPTGPTGTIDGVISAYENNAYDAALAIFTVQNPIPPNPIPTLGEWGAMIMALMMLFVVGGRRMVGR